MSKTKRFEELLVKVEYNVSLSGVDIPSKVYEQLIKSYENMEEIDPTNGKYPELENWIVDNVKERDCLEWKSEIIDFEE